MKRPDPREVEALARIAKNNPELATWIGEWYTQELEALPTRLENVAQAQGRCQVLRELLRALRDAPDWAAKPANTHTDRSV